MIIDSLGFSKTEANGFLVLIVLVFLVGIVPRIYLGGQFRKANSSKGNQSLAQWEKEMNASISEKEAKKYSQSKFESAPQKEFDPNESTVEQMQAGGVPKYLAERITKYRAKGGRFKKPDDLKKMYGMTDSIFARVHSFVDIPTSDKKESWKKDTTSYKSNWPKQEVVRFELNTATAEELQNVSGIGPVLSDRIVKYRDLLGGFHSTDQLKEVWGLKPEIIDKMLDQSDFEATVGQITVNTDSIKLLTKHPYINYNLARAIINYREVHGTYESLEDLMKIKVMDDSLYQKLSPYLSL